MPSDEELMLAVARGDLGAFEQLVVRYQGLAWSVAYRLLGNRTEAEDIAQEAFLRLLSSAERYQPISSFRTYFYRIITNLATDFTRRKRPSTADLGEVPSARPSGAETAAAGDRAAAVDRALAALPENQRAAVMLLAMGLIAGGFMGRDYWVRGGVEMTRGRIAAEYNLDCLSEAPAGSLADAYVRLALAGGRIGE